MALICVFPPSANEPAVTACADFVTNVSHVDKRIVAGASILRNDRCEKEWKG